VPEWGPLGSVRGALSNERPYRNLRNVGANYPFERSRRFPAIQPDLVTGDGSRLSCGVEDTAILDPRLCPLVIGERVRDKIAKTQPDVRPMSWPPSAKVRARLIVTGLASEMLLRSQRKLHHAFQELVRRQADEVVHDELWMHFLYKRIHHAPWRAAAWPLAAHMRMVQLEILKK
jgi:hypothetical protein